MMTMQDVSDAIESAASGEIPISQICETAKRLAIIREANKIICPVCGDDFIYAVGVSRHSVSMVLNRRLTSHETCGECGDWQGEDLSAIMEGMIVEL